MGRGGGEEADFFFKKKQFIEYLHIQVFPPMNAFMVTHIHIHYSFAHVCVTRTEIIVCREEEYVSHPEYCCGGGSVRTTVFGNEKPPVWKTGKQASRIYHYLLGMLGDQVMRLLFTKR